MPKTLNYLYNHIELDESKADPWNAIFEARHGIEKYSYNGNIAVVGSGIAAGVIAYELSKIGCRIEVFEQNERLGGRVKTHRFTPDQYGELGAMRIPSNHKALLDYVKKFNLPTRPFSNWNEHGSIYYGSEHLRFVQPSHGNGPSVFESAAFPDLPSLSQSEMQKGALEVFKDRVLSRILQQIENPVDCIDILFNEESRNEAVASIMATNLRDFALSPDCGLTSREWELISRVSGMAAFDTCPIQQFLLGMLPVLDSESMLEIPDGMDSLIEAFFANSTNCKVHLNSKITKVVDAEDGVSIEITDVTTSSQRRSDFDWVVVTVPPTSLRKMEFLGGKYTADVASKIGQLTLRPLLKVLLNFSDPFWESSDRFAEGGLFSTDLDIAQAWYPSKRSGLNEVASTVLVGAYQWADLAGKWMGSAEEELVEMTLNDLAQLHDLPLELLKSKLLGSAVVKWDEAYTLLEIGKHTELIDALSQRPSNQRTLFAGEHTNLMHGWMMSSVTPAQEVAHHIARHSGFEKA